MYDSLTSILQIKLGFSFFGIFLSWVIEIFLQIGFQMKLLKERDSLAQTAKKLSRDLVKVITIFKFAFPVRTFGAKNA